MEPIVLARMILGFLMVFFVPGYALTWALFPGKKEVDYIERFALAVGLSISVVVLVIYLLNVSVGVKINFVNSVAIILSITAASYTIYLKRLKKAVKN